MSTIKHHLAYTHRMLAVLVLGFSSGLPLALAGQSMQAWLSGVGIPLATIGFLSLVGIPYTFKFLWAPLIDRFDIALLGRRRGWLCLTQLGVGAALYGMASVSPLESIRAFAMLAFLVAFISATQDIVVDAYRTDILQASERGVGASMTVLGYRLALVLSGGIAFIWVDPVQGGAWTWPQVYRFMAILMVGAAVFSLVAIPSLPTVESHQQSGKNDLLGFAAVVVVVLTVFVLTAGLGSSVSQAVCNSQAPMHANIPIAFPAASLSPAHTSSQIAACKVLEHGLFMVLVRQTLELVLGTLSTLWLKWAELLALVMGLCVGIPAAIYAARKAQFTTLLGGLGSFFAQPSSKAILLLIVLYKLPDAFAGSLLTPFLLQGMNFSVAEMGVVNKILGLCFTLVGALIGGIIMISLGLWRSLMVFGILQMLSNLGFWWLADAGKGLMGFMELPAFNWGFVQLASATPVDISLMGVVALENLSGGMGTAAFVALLMSLCQQRFTATQFALLSALASIGRVWVGPFAGVLASAVGWPSFFILSTLAAAPALYMLLRLKAIIKALTP